MPRPRTVSPAFTLGLFAAWALHDAEEVASGPSCIRENVPVLRERFPQLPEYIWEFMAAFDDREFRAALAVMALIVGAVAVSGYRSGGHSAFFQSTLDGFGPHGLPHLAQAAAVRGCTPGSATSAGVGGRRGGAYGAARRGRFAPVGVMVPVDGPAAATVCSRT
ncbi:hypothetical protein SNA_32470 [Streptomyces natalensis ATCC 27448]|uniref:HXXEE domain-containing protein n=1 Tax=Streptomyces natalensis ATCC 27448 TaxID=1240678 RepID=A0A0D7CD91_9ACTN|nr:hypothetical protein SNA_32470 [Streptomyces natalensis ATCC 27448]